MPQAQINTDNACQDSEEVSIVTHKYLKLIPFIFNIVILLSVFVAMYFAAQQPEKLTEIFFSIFLTAFIITIICAWVAKYVVNAFIKR